MSEKMMSYCGIECDDCPLMMVTLEDDPEQLELTARWVRQEWNIAEATWENIRCEGCKEKGIKADLCLHCAIRACALAKGLDHCAECELYLNCHKLERIHRDVPEAKTRLDKVYARLNEY